MIIERILLNIFLVVLPIIMLPLLFNKNHRLYLNYRKNYFILAAILASLACMTFTIPINTLFNFDFRFIPFLLVSLYFGPKASLILFVSIMSYRYYLGGTGVLLAGIISIVYLIISLVYSRKFIAISVKKRIVSFTLIQTGTWIFVFGYMKMIHGAEYYISHGILLVSQVIAAFIVIYLKEYIQANLHLQSKLIKSEKMEIVSHLAASISHEVRNPLTTVRGFLQLLIQMIDIPKQKEYLTISIQELDRAEAIIRTYLSFAKPAPNKLEVIEIKQEFLHLIEIIRPLANQQNVSVQFNIEDKLFIIGESQLFQQCFINIMKNSIEAMPNGGILKIIAYIENKKIIIKIEDNGIGMTKEQIDRLGEPYFSTKGSKGTGLGMMVVITIIETMRGSWDIKSNIGKGTVISITLPFADHFAGEDEVAVHKEE